MLLMFGMASAQARTRPVDLVVPDVVSRPRGEKRRMRFPHDRYDAESLVAQALGQQPELVDGSWTLSLRASPDEFEVYVRSSAESAPASGELIDFLRNLPDIDNQVQSALEEQFTMKLLPAELLDLYVGYVDLSSEPTIVRYWGRKVNTECEAIVERDLDGIWKLTALNHK